MKKTLVLVAVALVVPVLAGLGGSHVAPCAARASTLQRVDDPPPDPTDCPFCGGNPELHRVRIRALLKLTAGIFERAVP